MTPGGEGDVDVFEQERQLSDARAALVADAIRDASDRIVGLLACSTLAIVAAILLAARIA